MKGPLLVDTYGSTVRLRGVHAAGGADRLAGPGRSAPTAARRSTPSAASTTAGSPTAVRCTRGRRPATTRIRLVEHAADRRAHDRPGDDDLPGLADEAHPRATRPGSPRLCGSPSARRVRARHLPLERPRPDRSPRRRASSRRRRSSRRTARRAAIPDPTPYEQRSPFLTRSCRPGCTCSTRVLLQVRLTGSDTATVGYCPVTHVGLAHGSVRIR